MVDNLDWDIETNQPIQRKQTVDEPPPPRQHRNVITCRDCGGKVSRNAAACPHCGSKAFDAAHAIGEFGSQLQAVGFALLVLGAIILIPILLALF